MELKKPDHKNDTESHKIDGPGAAIAPAGVTDAANVSVGHVEAKETSTDQPQSDNKGPQHHLVYIATGVWSDINGQRWCREEKVGCITHKLMSDAEYKSRPDIVFMVKYGSIKDVLVR